MIFVRDSFDCAGATQRRLSVWRPLCRPGGRVDSRRFESSRTRNRCSMASGYFPSTVNASSTFPGMPFCTYPELMTRVPPLIAGPATFSEPPRPGTPFVVL